jgi:HTH-type transcriptional regulator/antitoxin HigA
MPKTYFDLVRKFPLIPIRNDAHLAEALEVIDALLQQDLDNGAQNYLDVLTDLVAAYERQHVPMADAAEADVLRELLRANGLSQPRLAAATEIAQSTISAVLNGSRSLTKPQVITLAQYFKVSPAAFLPK